MKTRPLTFTFPKRLLWCCEKHSHFNISRDVKIVKMLNENVFIANFSHWKMREILRCQQRFVVKWQNAEKEWMNKQFYPFVILECQKFPFYRLLQRLAQSTDQNNKKVFSHRTRLKLKLALLFLMLS